MKRPVSIFLAFLVLLSNVSLATNKHYCLGEVMKFSVSLGAQDISCGMAFLIEECAPDDYDGINFKRKPCCQNEHQVFNTDELAKENTGYELPVIVGYTHTTPGLFTPSFSGIARVSTLPCRGSPSQTSLRILYQSFQI